MLILSRKEDEALQIGENITIKVLKIDKNSIKIGVDAPKNITVFRKELLQEIERTNQETSLEVELTDLGTFSRSLKK